jgi:DNA invertase Pin-like site-specific DNA recombinase
MAFCPTRRRSQLAEQYKIGMSALELARQYGIHRHTVVKHLQRDGIVIRGSQVKMTPDMIERAKQLYTDGQSLAVIGERLRVDASTVHKVPKKAGVKMRDKHGRQN